MRLFLIIILVILLLIPVALGLYLIIFNSFYKKYFSLKGEFLKGQNKKFLSGLTDESKIFDDFEEIRFFCGERTLRGKYKNNGNNLLAILTHSFGCDHRQMAKISKFFMAQGFDVLAVDLYSEKRTECSYGINESENLDCFITRMLEINGNYKIVMFGIGLGGASQLFALDKMPKNVKLIICESSFDNGKKQLLYLIDKSKIKFSQKLFFNFLNKTKNIDFNKNKILENIKISQIPILIFHDEKDEIVPLEMAYSFQENLPNKEIILLKDCGHGEGIEKQGYLFKNTIKKYLKIYGII